MENSIIKAKLSKTPLGSLLNEHELITLIAHSKLKKFVAGEVILQQGKKCPGMYIIVSGTALVTAKILGEGGTYISTLHYGNLVGEISLIERGQCATSVIASTQVICLLISNKYFEMLDLVFPDTKHKIVRAILNEVCQRLTDLHNKITSFMTQAGMITRSMFSEVIKSLTYLTPVAFAEVDVRKDEIRHAKLFKNFDEKEMEQLLHHSALFKSPKNCPLITQGVQEALCFIVLRGAVLSSIIADNKVAKLAVIGPFALFASITCIDETKSSIINYTTVEKTIVLKIDATNLKKIQEVHKTLWFKLFELFCRSAVYEEHAADKLDVRLNSELYNR